MNRTTSAPIDNGASVDFGSVGGSLIDASKAMATDQEVDIRVFFRFPKTQTVATSMILNSSFEMKCSLLFVSMQMRIT